MFANQNKWLLIVLITLVRWFFAWPAVKACSVIIPSAMFTCFLRLNLGAVFCSLAAIVCTICMSPLDETHFRRASSSLRYSQTFDLRPASYRNYALVCLTTCFQRSFISSQLIVLKFNISAFACISMIIRFFTSAKNNRAHFMHCYSMINIIYFKIWLNVSWEAAAKKKNKKLLLFAPFIIYVTLYCIFCIFVPRFHREL